MTGTLGRACALALIAALTGAAGLAGPAEASHFRGSNLNWDGLAASTTPKISFTASFRRTWYSGSAADGLLAVGDVFQEYVGGTSFSFGDGTWNSERFRVIAINPVDDYVIAEMLDDTLNRAPLEHAYATGGQYEAGFSSCCNISALNNNSDFGYGDTTRVTVGSRAASPRSSLAPIIDVDDDGLQTFPVPTIDPLNRTLRWSLTDPAESQWTPPPGLTINPSTGIVSWDTTGVNLGLWSVSVTVEALEAGAPVSSTQLNFLIRVTDNPNQPPVFVAPTPDQETEFTIAPGATLTVPLRAEDPDAGDIVHIDHLGLPPGATLSSTDGNPGSATFTWTPPAGTSGRVLVSFTAQDHNASAIPRTIIVAVRASTKVAANPAVLDTRGTKVYLKPSARLTRADTGGPLAGKPVQFSVKGKAICTATTNADGVAACEGLVPLVNTVVGLSRYDARFAGEEDLAPSSAQGTLVSVNGTPIP